MTAETQTLMLQPRYHPTLTAATTVHSAAAAAAAAAAATCCRQQDGPNNLGVRRSTLLKLSEHIKAKQYCNNKDNAMKDRRLKRKIAPYPSSASKQASPPTTGFRPTKLQSVSPPPPGFSVAAIKADITLSPGQYSTIPTVVMPPPPIKPQPKPEPKVYYVSGLELLSWVSSKLQKLPTNSKIPQETS